MLRCNRQLFLPGSCERQDDPRGTPPGLRFRGLWEVPEGLGAAARARGCRSSYRRRGVPVAASPCHTGVV